MKPHSPSAPDSAHIHIADIQPPERYPCTLRQVNEHFGFPPVTILGFGWPDRSFIANPSCEPGPALEGDVLVAVTYGSDLGTSVCVYPVHRDRFTDAAEDDLVTKILPLLRRRLDEELERPTRAGQLVVVWNGSGFRIHAFRS